VVIRRGSLWWADLGEPRGSAPGLVRPVVVISADTFNASKIATVVIAVVTSNMRLGDAPGNVTLRKGTGGIPKASVVNVSQLATIDKQSLMEELGQLDGATMDHVERGLRRVLTL
jgi:mRNA interferase MazF